MMAHIDFVVGISELIDDTHIAPKPSAAQSTDILITPPILNSYYQIPTGSNATNPKSTQAIGAFDDQYYSEGAVAAFAKVFGIADVDILASGPNCLNNSASCGQYESNLDVQYVTAIGLGVNTEFLSHIYGEWILDWALALSNRDDVPLVHSLSYG